MPRCVPEDRRFARHSVIAEDVHRISTQGARSARAVCRQQWHAQMPLQKDGVVGAGQAESLARHGWNECHPPAFPARCDSRRGTSRPVAGSGNDAAFTWVSRADHQCWCRTSPSGSSIMPVRVLLASGSRARSRRRYRASSSPATVARDTTSRRSHPSMGSARAKNCMTPAVAPQAPHRPRWRPCSRPRSAAGWSASTPHLTWARQPLRPTCPAGWQ